MAHKRGNILELKPRGAGCWVLGPPRAPQQWKRYRACPCLRYESISSPSQSPRSGSSNYGTMRLGIRPGGREGG
eukprot:1266321-Amorphochlora_amoeboformis.AAC.2